jgi:ribosomal protein L32
MAEHPPNLAESKTLSEKSAWLRMALEKLARLSTEFSILDWSKTVLEKSQSERLQPMNLQPDKSCSEKSAPHKSCPDSVHPRIDGFFAFSKTLPVDLCIICTILHLPWPLTTEAIFSITFLSIPPPSETFLGAVEISQNFQFFILIIESHSLI